MNTEQYHHLLRDFCAETGLDAQKLIEDGLVTVSGTDMLLFYDEANPGRLHVRVDMGSYQPEIEDKVWRALAIANYEWGLDGSSVFSMHPRLGNVILTLAQPITLTTTGPGLADVLRGTVQEARRYWETVQTRLQDARSDTEMVTGIAV
jgi:hypothetical protein